MKFLAVYTYDDQPELGFQKGYPKQCFQFDDEESAKVAHPTARIMSEEDYLTWHSRLQNPVLPAVALPKFKKPNWFMRIWNAIFSRRKRSIRVVG